jgi:hypothetical protein
MHLTERDQEFLDREIRAFRIVTKQHVRDFCGGSDDAAKKLLGRLKDYVAPQPFVANKKVYGPTALTARLFGAPEEIANPVGEQALATVIGVSGFCHQGAAARPRYTRREFKEDFPPDWVEEHLGKDYYSDFYLDREGKRVRLGRIAVDLGGDCQRFVRKYRGRIRQWKRSEGLGEVIRSGLFALAIVVPNEPKRQAIEDAIREQPLGVWVRVEVVSELGELLMGGFKK